MREVLGILVENTRAAWKSPNDLKKKELEPWEVEAREQMLNTSQKCRIHPQEMVKAFDKDLMEAICFKCLLGKSKGHNIVMFEDISDKIEAEKQ